MPRHAEQPPGPAPRSTSRIVVVGDALLDVVVRARPVPAGGDRPATIRLGPGGQAANVAVRLARRGARVRLVAALARDPAGELLSAMLRGEGVELDPMPAERTGSVVVMLDAAGERTMLSDRASLAGAERQLADALRPRLAGAGWIHSSGYALVEPTHGAVVASLLAEASARVSADGGSVHAAPGSAARLAERLRAARPAVFFASRSEAEAIVGGVVAAAATTAPGDALAALAERLRGAVGAEVAIVTGGAAGSAAATAGRRPLTVPAARSRRVVDTTGAGDAYAAAVIDELVGRGRWPASQPALRAAMAAASRLAGQVVAVAGAQGRVAAERRGARRLGGPGR